MPIKHLFFNNNQPQAASQIYWGDISGSLVMQADLASVLDSKSNLNHEHINLYEPKNSNIQNHISNNYLHLPSMTNNSGKFLKSDGTNAMWDNLPSSLELISQNLTIQIRAGLVDNITSFNNVQDALNSLSNKWISPAALVTLEVDNGIFTNTSAITINHPCSERIRLIGKNAYDANLLNIYSYTGSVYAWNIVLTVDTVVNMEVGNYLIIKSPSSSVSVIKGAWKITAVDTINNRVTLFVTTNRGNPTNGACTGAITIIKSVLKFSATTGIILQSKFMGLSKLVIEGSLLPGQNIAGIYADKTQFQTSANLVISSFEKGIYLENSSAKADGLFVSSCRIGSTGWGVYANCGSSLLASNSYFCGNYTNVFNSQHSSIDCRQNTNSGGTYGFWSEKGSWIDANSATVDNITNYYPSANTIGNYQAFINTN